MRICAKCNCSKHESDFYLNHKTGQLHTWCKDCCKSYYRKGGALKSKKYKLKAYQFKGNVDRVTVKAQARNKRLFIRKLWGTT